MRTILGQIKQYKKDSILTPLFTALEVIMEVMLPFVTALIIDEGIQEGNMGKVYTYGGIMVVMALVSLMAGALAGKYAASASHRCAPISAHNACANAAESIFPFLSERSSFRALCFLVKKRPKYNTICNIII